MVASGFRWEERRRNRAAAVLVTLRGGEGLPWVGPGSRTTSGKALLGLGDGSDTGVREMVAKGKLKWHCELRLYGVRNTWASGEKVL